MWKRLQTHLVETCRNPECLFLMSRHLSELLHHIHQMFVVVVNYISVYVTEEFLLPAHLDLPRLSMTPCDEYLCVDLQSPFEHLRDVYNGLNYKLRLQYNEVEKKKVHELTDGVLLYTCAILMKAFKGLMMQTSLKSVQTDSVRKKMCFLSINIVLLFCSLNVI